MPYVMVPVPEEHVQDVLDFVLRAIARASVQPWDAESLTKFFLEIDEPGRMLLSVVAHAVRADKPLTEDEASERIELSRREMLGILQELNELAQAASRPPLLVRRKATDVLPNGRIIERAVVAMEPEIAALVYEAERVELSGEGPPPQG